METLCGEIRRIIVRQKDLATLSLREARFQLALACGLPESSFDARKHEIHELIKVEVQARCREADVDGEQWAAEPERSHGTSSNDQDEEDIGKEDNKASKKVYLVTFPHPKKDKAANGMKLKPPSSYTKREITAAMLDAVEKTQGPRLTPQRLLMMSVFRERHRDGPFHFHAPVMAQRQFRFQPLKDVLLRDYGLASHWSCSHEGYASCVAYCYVPSPRKPMQDLDDEPDLWPRDGPNKHPPLEQASRAPQQAQAWAKRREQARRARAEEGKPERFRAIDVWPIVIRENVLDIFF